MTGEPAAWYARVEVRQSLHPASFLLLFLGPLGWLVLFALAVRTDGTYVEVPMSQQVYEEIHERRRRFRLLLATMVVSVIALAILAGEHLFPAAWLVFVPSIAMGFWVGAVKGHGLRLTADGVGLVTMKKVHPRFVEAVNQWRRETSRSTTPL